MGTRDRERQARIRAGLELTTAKKRDLQGSTPCAGCGTPIPERVLRDAHGDPAWCGVLVVTVRDNPAEELVICPACARILKQVMQDETSTPGAGRKRPDLKKLTVLSQKVIGL